MGERNAQTTVVLDGPIQFPFRRVRRVAVSLVGSLLYLVGLLSAVAFVVFTYAGCWTLLNQSQHSTDHEDWPSALSEDLLRNWLAASTLMVCCLLVGLRLVRGKRRLVLFLRRFGDRESTRAVSRAAETIGTSWRMVTLDDAAITPLGVGTLARNVATGLRTGSALGGQTAQAGVWVFKRVLFLACVAELVMIGLTLHRGEDVTALFDLSPSPDKVGLSVPFQTVAVGLIVTLGLLPAILIAYALTITAIGLVWPAIPSVTDSVERAEQAKVIEVHDQYGIASAATEVGRWRGRVFSPKLFVLRVDSPVWQPTVQRLAAASPVPLIDISEPSENLIWEIETLTERFGQRCVFVAHLDRLDRFMNTAPAPTSTLVQQTDALIEGHAILAYTTDERGVKRFARALRATLQDKARRPLPQRS